MTRRPKLVFHVSIICRHQCRDRQVSQEVLRPIIRIIMDLWKPPKPQSSTSGQRSTGLTVKKIPRTIPSCGAKFKCTSIVKCFQNLISFSTHQNKLTIQPFALVKNFPAWQYLLMYSVQYICCQNPRAPCVFGKVYVQSLRSLTFWAALCPPLKMHRNCLFSYF